MNGNKVESILQGNVNVDLDVGMWATAPLLAFSSRRTFLGGANNWQVSDDTGDDVFWDPRVHDRRHMVNFTAAFLPSARLYIVTKYGLDYGARLRFDGHNFIINLSYATGLLDRWGKH